MKWFLWFIGIMLVIFGLIIRVVVVDVWRVEEKGGGWLVVVVVVIGSCFVNVFYL